MEILYPVLQGEAMEVVAVIGASSNESRYSYKAIHLLKAYGHKPVPVSPRETEILGFKVVSDLDQINEKIDTVTMYVNAQKSEKMLESFLKLKPKRVIFNPGSENYPLMKNLEENGIKVEEACTLVLLRTNQY